MRPTYVGPHALVPAEGGGSDPARAPGLGVVAAEGSRDQDGATVDARADSSLPVHATAAVSADAADADVTAPAEPAAGRPVRAARAAQRRRGPKRRTKNFDNPLGERVTFRVAPEVKARWQAQADELDESLALMLERWLLAAEAGVAPSSSVPDVLDALVDELAAVRPELGAWGNNLNQIARQLNMGGTLPADPAAIRFLDRGQELLEQVRSTLRTVDAAVTGAAKARRRP
ncbi:MobC family plasmid mobilization relaxosome protein [Streptacidiphilus melanogenes]|uniref:MobC family plasmid mobilization relaxosome protein n=1 Tax=Streptacidiphilus melanogenes TaxID=411235 RepID=UPI000695009B|nr:MobC family plasmid mobilization relaxosome protein [Streptacidiphilus melanogenes]